MTCDFLTTCESNRLIGLGLKRPWGARSKDAFGAGLLSSPEHGCEPAVLRRQHPLRVHIGWAQTIQRPTLHLSAGQLAVWDFSELLHILICVARPRDWPWVTRAARDPSRKGSCLQSQPKWRLPLERCEYATEVYGYPSDTWHTGQRLQTILCASTNSRDISCPIALLLLWNLAPMRYFKENSWDLQARSCGEISNSSSLTGARVIYTGLVQHSWEIADGKGYLFVCCTENLKHFK